MGDDKNTTLVSQHVDGHTLLCRLNWIKSSLDTESLFEIPANWVWCKLGSICHLITDGTHHTPSYKVDIIGNKIIPQH